MQYLVIVEKGASRTVHTFLIFLDAWPWEIPNKKCFC